MRSRSFRSVGWVATIAGTALSCYLVSLRVASERAALEDVETEIVLAQRDIRVLQTEIGTRGRLAQLERWNVKVLALSAPSADQFVESGFALAALAQPERKVDMDAPVVLASAPADNQPTARIIEADYRPDQASPPSMPASAMLQQASLKRAPKSEPVQASESLAPKAASQSVQRPVKAAAKSATNAAKAAAGDPLAPLPTTKPLAKEPRPVATASAFSRATLKDTGQAR